MKVIVDENAGPGTAVWNLFQATVENQPIEYLFLSESHPGIPDIEILEKLLAPEQILLTQDCVLHMHALQRGFRSCTLNTAGKLTRDRLPGVRISELPLSVYRELQDDYRHQSQSDLTQRLTRGLTEKQSKHYRTARRRIRSHFGSGAAIAQLSITIGERLTPKGLLCGFVFNLDGNSGVKGLRGSEGYCLSTEIRADAALAPIQALHDQFLLQLEQVPTNLFIISPQSVELCRSLRSGSQSDSSTAQALGKLLHGVTRLTLHPCIKGHFYNAMQRKLEQLSRGHSNEVTNFDISQITTNLLSDSLLEQRHDS